MSKIKFFLLVICSLLLQNLIHSQSTGQVWTSNITKLSQNNFGKTGEQMYGAGEIIKPALIMHY